ncbi:MAG TPA: NAD-dependent epimerase/dehydratase family protein [Dermatophilaceae bacterium]|nr:NAD-dependent epimerase/dehydratase family protein [Dermatophilaceae bacterium]
MKVVVTGASGNVGTSVVSALAADPDVTEIVGIARRPWAWRAPKLRSLALDVSRDDLAGAFAGADAVVHLAWLFQPARDPLTTWRNNVLGSLRVFDAAASANVEALVHASSVGTYSPGPPDGRPVDESWPTHSMPTAAYGREKAYLERALDAFELAHPAMRVVRLRPCFIFKAESAASQRRLFAGPLLPARLVGGKRVPVVPDVPGLAFQAIHSADAAEGYRLAVKQPVRGPFNLAADPVLTPKELGRVFGAPTVRVPARLMLAGLRLAFAARLVPAPPSLLRLFLELPLLDASRARTELGWTPARSGVEAMEAVLEGWRERVDAPTPPLALHAGGPLRAEEIATGVGARDAAAG